MNIRLKRVLVLAGLLLAPWQLHAHSAGAALNGWHDGFNHPLHGWDHLLVMIAVGLWAAQQRGKALWLIPLTFVGVMTLGGVVGVTGMRLPGVELAILLSVAVFSVLVARRIHFRISISVTVVGFFAFFHGFAHGAEMPGSASMITFALGFVLATLLLHALGLLTARGIGFALACLVGSSAMAQQTTNNPATPVPEPKDETPARLPTVVVYGREDSMVGIAESASQGTVGQKQLEARPIMRSGEILETVPGVIITQHAGGGKANQYFLRGFNLDHGTDFATFLDGMPLNLPTHAHGQGYADMNSVIPEFVQRLNYEKGPYYAHNGDFTSVGAAYLNFYKVLPQDFVTVEGGMYGYARSVFGFSSKVGEGVLLYGGEAYHDDGPWDRPDDYQKFNGILSYTKGDDANGFSFTGHAYHGKWNSSDQIAESFGQTNFFGSIDPTTGGNSQRYSIQGEWHRSDDESATRVMAYGFYYDLDLFSNFTYFLTDPVHGDQFNQSDRRWVTGLDASHTLFNHWFGRETENTFGLQIRNDWIDNGLFQTQNRIRVDKIDTSTVPPTIFPAITRQDSVTQTEIGLYYQNQIQWTEKFRSVVGVRGDIYHFQVNDVNPLNSGSDVDGLASPKMSLIFGPWGKTEFYVNGGFGFHSNDGRGTTTTVLPEPGVGSAAVKPVPGLIQTKGAELGVRTLAIPGLQSTLSFWYLYSDSELLFEGDTGNTVPSTQPSNRYGVEWANYYSITKWLTLDLDYADSVARFTRPDEDGGTHVPEAIEQVVTAGLTAHDLHGFTASLRLRYFGPRALISDNSVRSDATLLLNLQLGYQISKNWSVTADIFNLLDRRDHDIDYFYESRVTPTAAALPQIHFHPVEPIQARIAVTARF